MASLPERIAKHARLNWQTATGNVASPPFVTFFINSICNMKCEHCFYWQQLNQKTDLTYEEIVDLSEDMGKIQTLYLSGGEPFLRKEFAEICHQFITRNEVEEIYVPSNGYFLDRTVAAITKVLENKDLKSFTVEFSLDGMPEFHDEFRKTRNAFSNLLETYDALAEIVKKDDRLHIHAISTATETNMDDLKELTTFLYDRCPAMEHHNLGIIRGDRKNASLQGPALDKYRELYDYLRALWAPREKVRPGSMVEPMLQYMKLKTIEVEEQVVPCKAGVIATVIHANGDVGVCEQREPLGNLRDKKFSEMWHAHETEQIRKAIKCKECYCTNEIYMWTSMVFQPQHLAKTMIGAKVWQDVPALENEDRVDYREKAGALLQIVDPSEAV